MANETFASWEDLPLHNLGLYRLRNTIGRQNELQLRGHWFREHPVVAITGPSGAGKSTLATMLAVQEAHSFAEGILWISAAGNTAFNFYDIVRTMEDVLATGITSKPVSVWPLYVLQQLYGFNRLLILDELTEANADTVEKIIAMIGQIQPGGYGRFVLIGRTLPQRLLDIAGPAHLTLGGLDQPAVAEWLQQQQEIDPIPSESAISLHRISGGHPLALKLMVGLWESPNRDELFDLVSVHAPTDWEARLRTTVMVALESLNQQYPPAYKLLIYCSQASGGFGAEAMKGLYWPIRSTPDPDDTILISSLQQLLIRGLLLYNPQTNRYFIHPLIRRYLNTVHYADLSGAEKSDRAKAHAVYYLRVARRYESVSDELWYTLDEEWGNIRKAIRFLLSEFETRLGSSAHAALQQLDNLTQLPLSAPFLDLLKLLRDYTFALRRYLVARHPPEGYDWLAAGIVATRILGTSYRRTNSPLESRRTEALMGEQLAGIALARQDYQTAQSWYQNSLSFFQEAENLPKIIKMLRQLARTARATERLAEALTLFREALHIAAIDELHAIQADIQAEIGLLYYEQGDYEAAVDWGQKALAWDQGQDNESGQAARHNDIGRAVEAQGNIEVAIEHYQAAARLYQRLNDNLGLSVTYDNLGAAYYHAGQPAAAIQWYEQDLAIIDGLGHWFDMAATLHNMGHVALDMDSFQAAADYFTRSRDIYLQFGQLDLAEEEQLLIDTIQDRHTTVG